MRSRILVMDEPTAGQDYHNYMNFMDAILQMPGFEAILFITHDVDLAVIYANRVLLVADGTPGRRWLPARSAGRPGPAGSLPPGAHLAAGGEPGTLPRTGTFLRAEALAHIHIIMNSSEEENSNE